MVDERKAPALRFDGFFGDWYTGTLGELTDVYDGTHQTPVYTESGIMFLSVENIKTLTSKKYISEVAFYKDFKVFPQKGDVLMTRIGDIGTANIVDTNKPVAYYVSLALLKKRSLDPYFLKTVIHTEAVWRDLWHRTLHIAFPKKINMNEIKKVSVSYPVNTKEQTAIGNFFLNIDDTINLKKQQHEKTLNLKKSMLEKMFPKKGADVPEIRFDGFTEPWREWRLGEVATFINGRAYSQDELLKNGKYKILRVGNFYTNDSWYYSNMELDEKYYANAGDLLYTWSATFGPHIWLGDKVIYHYHIWKVELSEHFDKPFAVHVLEYDKAKILADSHGSTMIHITKKGMEEKTVLLPSVAEQRKIGKMLESLDVLTEIQREEIKKLQNIKKACLDKMFV